MEFPAQKINWNHYLKNESFSGSLNTDGTSPLVAVK
jgi:hypothetical protein